MNRETRARLASETLEILEAGRYVSASGQEVTLTETMENCLAGTRYLEPEKLYALRDTVFEKPSSSFDTHIELANETTLEGAFQLCDRDSAGCAGVLNFASAKKPGGGFLGGSQAQEESLARSSGLYKSLLQCPAYYEYHRENRDLLYSHRLIYSPRCPIFRNDTGQLLDTPGVVDFLTCPAPNAGAIRRKQPDAESRIQSVLRERMTLLLGAALHFGITDLVLGAWGCGVFQNDPAAVAAGFCDALIREDLFARRFSTVRFSVLDPSNDRATIQAFALEFRPGGGSRSGT